MDICICLHFKWRFPPGCLASGSPPHAFLHRKGTSVRKTEYSMTLRHRNVFYVQTSTFPSEIFELSAAHCSLSLTKSTAFRSEMLTISLFYFYLIIGICAHIPYAVQMLSPAFSPISSGLPLAIPQLSPYIFSIFNNSLR